MPLSRTELGDLDKTLAQGPRLADGAILGAGVSVLIGWFEGRPGFIKNAAIGAAAGAFVNFLRYGTKQWASKKEHDLLEEAEVDLEGLRHRVGIAPYPYYRPSVTYPFSEH